MMTDHRLPEESVDPTDYRLADQVRRQARQRGAAPALSGGGVQLTYAELDDRTNRLANVLLDHDVTPGRRVAVLGKNSTEVVEVILAAAKIGAVAVPLNWRQTATELAEVLADATPAVVVHHSGYTETVVEIGRLKPEAPFPSIAYGAGPGPGSYENLIAEADDTDPGFVGTADDVVLQLYTSGTTGRSKGVLTSNTNLGACTGAGGPWGFDQSSVSLCAMPLFHIGGLGWALVGLACGAHNVVVADATPDRLLDVLVSQRITNAFLVPTVIQMLVDLPHAAAQDYSALRSIAYGSSPITPALLRRALSTFRGTPLFQVYGLTETHGAVTQLDAADHSTDPERSRLLRSVGKAYPWVELKIMATPDEEADTGKTGEIWVRTLQATKGYFARSRETAETITPDGWLRTGDIGYLDSERYLFVTDRLKDMIITGGENVYPTQIEAVLAEYPGVAQVAVVGIPDPTWGEAVTAFVVPHPGSAVDEAGLRAFARSRLAGYECPKTIHIVPSLPLGPTGKILKYQLRTDASPRSQNAAHATDIATSSRQEN